ncbi:hypothetical protein Pmani_006576 [Petrolisthes manimaculis]|uniref:Uncharacterized protein n=1 Tax=Petrolisthes manimaculis TaxID=1843537 RepID=A0AAE1QAP6_9EUCA|nr:hypothetical protein Pmani_006576 [Petrolisthes manimaculis]
MRKNVGNSEEVRIAYEEAWKEYEHRQKEIKKLIRKARVVDDKKVIESLRAKGDEGGKEWYDLLRGEKQERIRVDVLVVGGNIVMDTRDKVNAIQEFWEDIGGVNEAEDTSELETRIEEDMNNEISKTEIRKYM